MLCFALGFFFSFFPSYDIHFPHPLHHLLTSTSQHPRPLPTSTSHIQLLYPLPTASHFTQVPRVDKNSASSSQVSILLSCCRTKSYLSRYAFLDIRLRNLLTFSYQIFTSPASSLVFEHLKDITTTLPLLSDFTMSSISSSKDLSKESKYRLASAFSNLPKSSHRLVCNMCSLASFYYPY